jgi:hypothetical protein
MMTIENFKEHLPKEMLNMAQQYLLEDHTISMSENDESCYDAVIREGGVEHWVEVTLDSEAVIEDCYCTKCKSSCCIHTSAILLLIASER